MRIKLRIYKYTYIRLNAKTSESHMDIQLTDITIRDDQWLASDSHGKFMADTDIPLQEAGTLMSGVLWVSLSALHSKHTCFPHGQLA